MVKMDLLLTQITKLGPTIYSDEMNGLTPQIISKYGKFFKMN